MREHIGGGSSKGWVGAIVTILVLASMPSMIAYGLYDDSVRDKQREISTTKSWNKWLTYRDKNCKIVEKMYGLSETSGKFHQNDNAVVYECEGIKYVIAESVENAAKRKSLQEWQIPVIEKN